MFGIDGWEFALVVFLAVLILGPKELPQAMRTMAKVLRKVRGLASEFQGHFNDMVREAELDEVQKSVQKLSSTSVGAQVNKMIDPKGEIGDALRDNPLKDKTDTAADSAASSGTGELAQVPTAGPESEPETGTEPTAKSPPGETS